MPAYRVSAVRGRGLFLGTEEGIASLPECLQCGGGGYSWELRKGLPAYRVSAVRGRGLFLGTEEGIASLPSVCSAGAGVIPRN